MLSAVGGFGSCRVNDPLAGAVSRNIGLVAALALMPVIGFVILPIRAVAVGVSAACCGDRCGFKDHLADGAFLMLSAVGGFGSCRVNDPLAGAVSRNIGLVAALALVPVIGFVILPIRAVAVGMAGSRILIGGLKLHIVCGHGEGGGCLGGVCQSDIALQHDPLVKDLAGLRCVRRNGHNGVLLDLVGDGSACGNGGRALDNRERIRLYGIFGTLRLDRYIVCGHGKGGGGAGLVSQCYAACLNDPLDEVCSVGSLCRNGDLNALHGAGDGGACGNGCRAAGDGNGVIPQGGDLGILAALSMAAGAFLVLLAGLIQRRLLIHYPYPGMLGGFGVGGAVRHRADGAVAAVCAVFVIRPRRELVSLNVVAVVCLALLIVIAGIQIQVRLTGVVMLVVCIHADVVDRLGVEKDGQFNGSAGAGITQRALRHFNADGRGGGRRWRTADGDDQGRRIVGSLLDLGGQTCWQIGKPAGNIRACRKIFREYVATQRNAYVDRGDFFIYLADYACVGNSGIGNAGV